MSAAVEVLPKSVLGFFWYFIKRQWKWFLFLQIFYFAWSFDQTMWPYVLELLVDRITAIQGDRSEMWSVLTYPICFGVGLWIFVEILFRSAGVLSTYIFPRLEASVRMAMFNYVQHHSHVYFSTNFAGSLANKISDMTHGMTQILYMTMSLFLPVLLALGISAVMFAQLHPLFAFILVGWMAVHVTICLIFSRLCNRYAHTHAEARSLLSGKIVDSFTNHLNSKLFARQAFERRYLECFQEDEQQKHMKSMWVIEKMKMALSVACFLVAVVVLNWFMLVRWQQGLITTGEVVFIFNTAWNITMMAWFAGLELPNLFKEIGVCQQALTIIQDAHDIVDAPQAKPLKIAQGKIAFEHVTFCYVPNHNIFNDNNITLEAGHKIGLVGFSGSGKTTFVHLILRYFQVEKGRILIDDQDISSVTQESLRSNISMIPQDTCLFHRTIMENIRYGRIEATDEEVIEAAKKAHCHEFIEKLPEKYNTVTGERGIKLSGGQRQRIAIARAILKNAPILILDEATSSLDSMTEKQIQEGLEHLMQNRTTIVIAHRLSTLSGMDRIIVFKEGKIVEDGTHDELLNSGGHYATMWEMQAGGFLPEEG